MLIDLDLLSLAALLVVIAVSCMSRANPGIVAIALAGAIAAVAPFYGNSSGVRLAIGVKEVIGGFPTDIFVKLLGVSLLFTLAETNGTLALVSSVAQRLCRGNRGLIPIMFFLLSFGLGSAGPGNIAVAGIVAPVAMKAAAQARIPAFLMALMVGHGAIASTLSPFTAAGVTANGIMANQIGLSGHEWRIFVCNAVANTAVALGGFLLFGGWKLFRSCNEKSAAANVLSGDEGSAATVSEPLQSSLRHWITLAVIAAVVLGVVKYKADIGLAAFAGAAFLSVFRLADESETFRKLPWSVIVMVCGVSMLTALLDKTGGTKRFAALINTVSTPNTAAGVVAFVTGIISVYSSTTGVVLPAFLPMVKKLVEMQPGSDALSLCLSVLVGGNLVDMSPLSTIGALCIAGALPETDRRKLFNQLLAWGFALAVVGGILCWAWFGPSQAA